MKGLAVFIPHELHRKFKVLCAEKGLFVSKAIEILVTAAISKKELGQDLFEQLCDYANTESALKKSVASKMKLSSSEVCDIRKRINLGAPRSKLAEEYGVSVTIINRAYNGEGYYGKI